MQGMWGREFLLPQSAKVGVQRLWGRGYLLPQSGEVAMQGMWGGQYLLPQSGEVGVQRLWGQPVLLASEAEVGLPALPHPAPAAGPAFTPDGYNPRQRCRVRDALVTRGHGSVSGVGGPPVVAHPYPVARPGIRRRGDHVTPWCQTRRGRTKNEGSADAGARFWTGAGTGNPMGADLEKGGLG